MVYRGGWKNIFFLTALWHAATHTVEEVEPDVEQDLLHIKDDRDTSII